MQFPVNVIYLTKDDKKHLQDDTIKLNNANINPHIVHLLSKTICFHGGPILK